jgi:hypothetical protein
MIMANYQEHTSFQFNYLADVDLDLWRSGRPS